MKEDPSIIEEFSLSDVCKIRSKPEITELMPEFTNGVPKMISLNLASLSA